MYKTIILYLINPLASPSAGAPALNYGDVNTETISPGEVKGLINLIKYFIFKISFNSFSYEFFFIYLACNRDK